MVSAEKRIVRGLKRMASAKHGSSEWYWALRWVVGGTEDLMLRHEHGAIMLAWQRGIGRDFQKSTSE